MVLGGLLFLVGSVESVEIDMACGVGGRYSNWSVERNVNAYHQIRDIKISIITLFYVLY